MCEFFHCFFEGIPFDEYANLDDAIYYLVAQLGQLSLVTSIIIFLKTPKENKSSKAILFMLVGWNFKELIDEIMYLAQINDNVLLIDDGLCGQVVFLSTVLLGSYLYFSKNQK